MSIRENFLKNEGENREYFIKFNEYFPIKEIKQISQEEVPDFVMKIFEMKSHQFLHPDDYELDNFEVFFLITHLDDSKTYITQQTKTYDTNGETEMLTFFVDSSNNELEGYSELRLNFSNSIKYFIDKPFVGFTDTEQKFRNKGLGVRRLKIMNAFSESFYGLPIYSDTLITESAKRVWEKLVIGGEAHKFLEDKKERYGFFSKKQPK